MSSDFISGVNKRLNHSEISFSRAVGGREAERLERENWQNKERKRIQDSVDGKLADICAMYTQACLSNQDKRLYCDV